MSRPKQHASAATKQAAYRARLKATTAVVDRVALDHLHAQLEKLQGVILQAAQRGDALAQQCQASSMDTLLEKLIAAFEARPAMPEQAPNTRSG